VASHALVFVRLTHDRRFVVLFVIVVVLVVFIRVSGDIVLPMITKGLQSIDLAENSSAMRGVMLLLPPRQGIIEGSGSLRKNRNERSVLRIIFHAGQRPKIEAANWKWSAYPLHSPRWISGRNSGRKS
jgi:hypothetical protein